MELKYTSEQRDSLKEHLRMLRQIEKTQRRINKLMKEYLDMMREYEHYQKKTIEPEPMPYIPYPYAPISPIPNWQPTSPTTPSWKPEVWC